MPENAIIRLYLKLNFLYNPQPEWVLTILYPISSIIVVYRVSQSKVENIAYIHNIYHICISKTGYFVFQSTIPSRNRSPPESPQLGSVNTGF